MRVWKQPFFDDGICQLAVYKFSNASDYQVQQTQNLLLLAQLRNSTFVEIDGETGWEVWRTATHIVTNQGTQENLPKTQERWNNLCVYTTCKGGFAGLRLTAFCWHPGPSGSMSSRARSAGSRQCSRTSSPSQHSAR